MNRAKAHRLERGDDPEDVDMSSEFALDSDEDTPFPPATRGRGRGSRGRGARGRGRGELSYYIN